MHREDARLGAAPLRPGIRRRASARHARVRALGRALQWSRQARVVAITLGILAALGLSLATLGFVVDLFVAPWRLYTSDLELSLHLLASVICLAGAFRLSRGAHRARQVVLVGLALNVAATFAFSRDTVGRPETIVPLLTWFGLGAATVTARINYL